MSAHKDFYTPDEVAAMLDLHVKTVRRFIREGKIPAVRVGKQYRIAANELEQLVGTESPAVAPVARQRRVLVATTVDVDVISPEESQRISTALTAACSASRERTPGRRLDCIYYEEQGKLRVVIHADLEFTSAVLAMLSSLLSDR
jgi:excisionase family DNA binding protein